MIDIGSFAAPTWMVMLFGVLAVIASIVMLYRGHIYTIVPVAFSIGWITLGYFFYAIGSFDRDDLATFVRSGFITLCMTIIAGAFILWHGRRKK